MIETIYTDNGQNKRITTYVTLDIEEMEGILPDNIGGEDINTYEAICSLWEANQETGRDVFTLNDIYRVEKKNLKANPDQKGQELLKKKIQKIMRTLATIDSSEEKQAYYPDLFYRQKSNLLNADFIEVEIKGNKTKAIRVLDVPILYKYAKAKKQLTNIPFDLTNNNLIKTDSVLILERYLLRRIAQMRNNKHLTRNILYSTIYENMNFKQKSKSALENASAKTRINTEEILKGLIQKNYIKDYDITEKGITQYHKLIIKI